jgi:hypothetical protein
MISHLYRLRYLTNSRRRELMAFEPASNSDFLYNVTPVVRGTRYTDNNRFSGEMK